MGKVSFENKPMSHVSVYINNTTVGTITGANGEFNLHIDRGVYQLVISHVGFKTIAYNLDSSTYTEPLAFSLSEENFFLDDVAVVAKRNKSEWRKNYYQFFREFLGTTKFSKFCTIQNRDALIFEFDREKNILTARANEGLIIRNNALGYEILYDLEHFSVENKTTKYSGYAHFKELEGKKNEYKKWQKNRIEAYNGSQVHFYKSVLKNSTEEEGFVINQFVRRKNTESPSQEELLKARRVFASSHGRFDRRRLLGRIDNPKDSVDSAAVIMRKSLYPKHKDYLYNSDISSSDIIRKNESITYLQFENNLRITYLNEKEEQGYITRNSSNVLPGAVSQSSNIISLTDDPIRLYPLGILADPLSVLYEEYWSYEKFAHALPLDYEPRK